jgi:tetratricopeptide (TPR) repeat protein
MSIEPPPLAPSDSERTGTGAWATPAVKLQLHASPIRPSASEASLIARALTSLRRDHDGLWALDDLDEHDRQYPHGSLRREAALARAEALLALDRNGDALAVLDGVGLEASATDRRAQLARGELRAQDGRRPQAIGDFDRVLDSGGDDDLAARALYGRAVCRLRGGDLGGARADLRAYLQRFPEGHNRVDVTNMLGRIGG